jgi:O-antigen/teichoic acid export membrane protein
MVRQAVFIFSLALLMRSLAFLGNSVFVAHEKPRILLPIALFFRPAEALVGIAALLLGYGVVALAWIHTVSWGIQALAVLAMAVRRGIMPPLALPNRSGMRMLGQAFPLLLGGVLMGQIQQGPIIYYRWQGTDGLGQLSILVQLISTLGVIPMAGLQALLPAMSRKHIHNEKEASDIGKNIISLTLLGGTFGALAAMVLAPPILIPLLGQQYALAVHHMGLAVALLGLYGAALAVNQLQTARGEYADVLYAIGAGAGLMILAFTVLRPENALLALCLGGLGYAGWLLAGAKMLGLLLFVTKRLVSYGIAVAIPYAYGFQAWSILVSALLLVVLNLYFNWQHIPMVLQKIRERLHSS